MFFNLAFCLLVWQDKFGRTSLLTTGEEGIPLFMQVGDGNKLDSQAFPEMIKAFQSQWQGEKLDLLVMDAAFFEEENLIPHSAG
jgi:transposase